MRSGDMHALIPYSDAVKLDPLSDAMRWQILHRENLASTAIRGVPQITLELEARGLRSVRAMAGGGDL